MAKIFIVKLHVSLGVTHSKMEVVLCNLWITK